jgi:hypothetical protein
MPFSLITSAVWLDTRFFLFSPKVDIYFNEQKWTFILNGDEFAAWQTGLQKIVPALALGEGAIR